MSFPTEPSPDAVSTDDRFSVALYRETTNGFVVAGKALKEINENKGYRIEHRTFEEYVQVRWKMERRHAYRLIESSDLADILCPMGHIIPANERAPALQDGHPRYSCHRFYISGTVTPYHDDGFTAKVSFPHSGQTPERFPVRS